MEAQSPNAVDPESDEEVDLTELIERIAKIEAVQKDAAADTEKLKKDFNDQFLEMRAELTKVTGAAREDVIVQIGAVQQESVADTEHVFAELEKWKNDFQVQVLELRAELTKVSVSQPAAPSQIAGTVGSEFTMNLADLKTEMLQLRKQISADATLHVSKQGQDGVEMSASTADSDIVGNVTALKDEVAQVKASLEQMEACQVDGDANIEHVFLELEQLKKNFTDHSQQPHHNTKDSDSLVAETDDRQEKAGKSGTPAAVISNAPSKRPSSFQRLLGRKGNKI